MMLAPGARDEGADRARALSLVPVSRETEARLSIYVDLLRRWQTIKNLVGPSTLVEIWTRHIADSAQLVDLAPNAKRWVDLGAGAGFPGLVVAIVLADRPGVQVELIESNARKCAFLRDVIRATEAPARVHPGRIEAVLPTLQGSVDVVTSRALAPLPELLAFSGALLRGGALGLFLKGAETDKRPAQQPGDLDFTITTVASRTLATAKIVVVRAPSNMIGNDRSAEPHPTEGRSRHGA